jgi:hypothetical protein
MASCGGGGGSDSMRSAAQAPAGQAGAGPAAEPVDSTGVVAILIKDAPTLDFTRIVVHITSVELLGNGEPQVVFQGDKIIDLLELQNFYDMLAVSDQIAVGEYDKIRLRVARITLYCLDADGNEVAEDADIPANGKIDLNPRAPFTVSADTAILIEIDMDAKKSIHVHTTGRSRYKFRPVVFVDIQQREAINGLIRVSGMIRDIDPDDEMLEIDPDDEMLELCNLEVQFDTDGRHCVLVHAGVRDARTFDENGDLIPFDQLMIDQVVTVFGIVVIVTERGPSDESASEEDSVRMIQLDAMVIQRGDPEDLLSLDGEILGAPDTFSLFPFDVFAGQDFPDGPQNVLLQPATRIIDADDLSDLPQDAIQSDVIAEVSGILPAADEALKSILILIDPDDEMLELCNLEVQFDTDGRHDNEFSVSIEGEDPEVIRCVTPVPGARYFVLTNTTEGAEFDEVTFDFLEEDQTVSVFGSDAGSDVCFDADVTVVERSI